MNAPQTPAYTPEGGSKLAESKILAPRRRHSVPETASTHPVSPRGARALDLAAPSDLKSEGAHAFLLAVDQVCNLPDWQKYEHAIVRFARAVDMVAFARSEWADAGSPALMIYPNGAAAPHPLVKMIESSEVAAARAGKELGLLPGADKEKRPVGRPPGAASARDKAPPPMVTIAKRAG